MEVYDFLLYLSCLEYLIVAGISLCRLSKVVFFCDAELDAMHTHPSIFGHFLRRACSIISDQLSFHFAIILVKLCTFESKSFFFITLKLKAQVDVV